MSETEFIKLSDARQAMKGSFIGIVSKIGDLKSGSNDKGDFTYKVCTVEDATAKITLTVWNDEIKLLKLGGTYRFINPWWRIYKDEPVLALGKYASVELVEPIASSPKMDEAVVKKETPSSPPEPTAKIPLFEAEMSVKLDQEIMTLYMINRHVKKFIENFEVTPNGGMIGQFTEIIYNKHFKTEFKKASEV